MVSAQTIRRRERNKLGFCMHCRTKLAKGSKSLCVAHLLQTRVAQRIKKQNKPYSLKRKIGRRPTILPGA